MMQTSDWLIMLLKKAMEYINICHPVLLMFNLLSSTDDEYESGFVGDQADRGSQLKRDHAAAERGHMYMMSDLFGFVNDLDNITYSSRFKLILKGKNKDRALYRVIAGAGAVANEKAEK